VRTIYELICSFIHPDRYNVTALGKHTPGIRAGKIEPFEILGRRVAYLAVAALGKERFNLALINPEKNPLAGHPRRPLHHLHLRAARVAQRLVVEIVKDHRAARPGMVGDKSQGVIDALPRKVHDYALPDKQRFFPIVVASAAAAAVGEQALVERLCIKIQRVKGKLPNQWDKSVFYLLLIIFVTFQFIDQHFFFTNDPAHQNNKRNQTND